MSANVQFEHAHLYDSDRKKPSNRNVQFGHSDWTLDFRVDIVVMFCGIELSTRLKLQENSFYWLAFSTFVILRSNSDEGSQIDSSPVPYSTGEE